MREWNRSGAGGPPRFGLAAGKWSNGPVHHPTPATARTGSHPRDTARDALTLGTATPELVSLATACRGLRLRGCTPAEAATVVVAATKVPDAQALLGVFDYAWGVGDPGADPAEDVRASMPEIDVADLFGGSLVCAEMARWCAGEVVCGPDLPVLTMLAVFSAAAACKVVGKCGGWVNPPNLFLAAEVASGENKTRVRNLCGGRMLTAHAMGAVADWHDILNAAHGQRMIAARFAKKTKEAEIVKYKHDPIAVAEFTAELYALENELKRKSITTPGWLQEGKITPAQYIREMQLGGFVAAMPDEGKETLWEFVGGEGKKSGDLAPLLCAFSGEPCTNATIAGEQRGDLRRFHDFRATMWLPLQPGVLTPTTPEDGRMLANLGERGLLARLLIARPRPVRAEEAPSVREAHAREFGHPDVVETIRGSYRALLAAVLHGVGQVAEDGDGLKERREEEVLVGTSHPLVPARPWVFTYTSEAEVMLLDYQIRTRDSAKVGGPNSQPMLAEFVSRLADHAHRLATLLAVMRHGRIEGGGDVTAEDVGRALRFLDGYALPHVRGVYERATFAPIADDAETVLRIVRAEGEILKRDLQRKLPHGGRGWEKSKGTDRQTRLEVALETLEARGRIALLPMAKGSVLVRYVGQ